MVNILLIGIPTALYAYTSCKKNIKTCIYKHGDFSIRNNKIVKLFFKKLLTFSKSFL